MVEIKGKQNKDSIFLIKEKQISLEQAIAMVTNLGTTGKGQYLKSIDSF